MRRFFLTISLVTLSLFLTGCASYSRPTPTPIPLPPPPQTAGKVAASPLLPGRPVAIPTPVPPRPTPAPAGWKPEYTGGPRLKVSADSEDAGTLLYEEQVIAGFLLTNVGDAPLTFKAPPVPRVAEGCCPPTLLIGATTLLPGQSSTILTGFTMHEGMGGKHAFAIKVTSNDPVLPERELMIYSNFVAPGSPTTTPRPG